MKKEHFKILIQIGTEIGTDKESLIELRDTINEVIEGLK